MKSSGNVSQTPAIGLSHALSDVIKRFISSRFQNWFKVVTVLQTVKKTEYIDIVSVLEWYLMKQWLY